MNLHTVLTVWAKELREAVRDRRTLISTLVIPTFAVPVISLVAGLVMAQVMGRAKSEAQEVMVLGGADSPLVVAALKQNPKLRVSPAADDWRRRVADKQVRAVVEIPAGFDAGLGRGEPGQVKIFHYEGELRSGFAVGELRSTLSSYRERVVEKRLQERGLPAGLVKPFEISSANVAPPEKVGGNAIGGMIPYMFILFCVVGAIYPAIDVTAGEKERGTLETLLCSPARRIELVLGKFLMVLTASLTTVVCTVTSMGATIMLGGSILLGGGRGALLKGAQAAQAPQVVAFIDPIGLVAVVVLALPVAAMFSALLLATSLAARSSKEAQSYAMPLIMVTIVPAMMGMLPGIELNAKLALVPILNLALASKELLSGVWHWEYLSMIFLSSCLYAGAALAFCVRQFNREAAIFRS
jgi:sodium transport system permease protein